LNDLEINSTGNIFVASGKGIYVGTNDGVSWAEENSGLVQNSYLTNLIFDDAGFLYGTTYYYGIFKSVHSTLTSVGNSNDIVLNYTLGQNYPNPFNPSTTISFSISKSEDVKITVYDIAGKEIEVLLNESKLSGNYEINFNAKHLSSGIYFYKIQAGKFTQTKRMLLIK
jgi:Secretion system C-terminal sorting domain